ncbi:sulfotransferase ssu-1-like [Amblyomma americanum]
MSNEHSSETKASKLWKKMENERDGKTAATVSKARAAFEDAHRLIEGLYLNKVFKAETLRSALSYEPEEGDVFIASYPKCGTTWLQHIVLNIFFAGKLTPHELEKMRKGSYLEFVGAEGARKLHRPTAIKTHLPYFKLPYPAKAKYIYVTRNPYDCCVSYYHHLRAMPWHRFAEGTFDELLDMFIEGKVDYGDYFDHLFSWYEHRDDPNVLFLTYEEVKKNARSCVLSIADFLGKQEYGDRLRTNPEYLETVLSGISFETMKKLSFSIGASTDESHRKREGCANDSSQVPRSTQVKISPYKNRDEGPLVGDLVRKGVVGDWRNQFSPEKITRMKAWIARKTQGSDVMELWNDVYLP